MELQKIACTYLNIRQSITILTAKLIFIDFLFAFIFIGLYLGLAQAETLFNIALTSTLVLFLTFAFLGITKILMTAFIVLSWLNEYYEITPTSIVHRRGIISKKVELYDLDKVRAITIQASFIGELFNYATITLYDIRLHKYLDLYLIHNPQRYAHVLKELRPGLEIKEDSIRLPFAHKSDLIEEQS